MLHHSTYHYSVRVSDSKDNVLLETPGMRQTLAGAGFLIRLRVMPKKMNGGEVPAAKNIC